MTVETTASVGMWADETFGKGTVKDRSLRLLEEVCELCMAAGADGKQMGAVLSRVRDSHLNGKPVGDVHDELADCQIVLYTVAWTAMVDLPIKTEAKMRVNRYQRKWRSTGGGCGQHVKNDDEEAA